MYTLTGDEVFEQVKTNNKFSEVTSGTNKGSYTASAATEHTAGTKDFFTLYYAASSRVDPKGAVFEDDYASGHQINFSNEVAVDKDNVKNAVAFTTDGPATVKVWWTPVTDKKPLRPMVILNADGEVAATSATAEIPTVSTLELKTGGTYYLGGQGGKNFIHKVTVSEGGDSLGWAVAEDKLSITGDVGADQAVWAACWDMARGFIGAVPLTGVDPTASLPEGWATVKLMWLSPRSTPKCAPGLATRK